MRTVTFSDARVAEVVNSKFVPAWYNRGRGFHNCDLGTEKWIFESSGEAYPTRNICTFFLTPDLEVLTYVAGYYSPEFFLEVLEGAGRLHASPRGERARAHREFSAGLARRSADVGLLKKQPPLKYRDGEHAHTPRCRAVLEAGFAYRRRVHDALAGEGPVAFERVQHDYLFGNSFSEEAPAPTPTEAIAPPKVPAVESARLRLQGTSVP